MTTATALWLLALVTSTAAMIWRSDMPSPESRGLGVAPEARWLTQRLDHYDRSNVRTWSQRYYMNDQFYVPGGPAFLHIGGEREENPLWLKGGQMMELARKYHGTAFMLEHRYYGESLPIRNTSTKDLKFLNSQQALADIAYFIEFANTAYDLQDSKWIVYGGSYSGNLAAWMRGKYAHLVHGAVAHSAPLLAKVDYYEYYEAVAESLSMECIQEVENATAELLDLWVSENGTEIIMELFKLCEPASLWSIQDGSAGLIADIVQDNNYKFDNISITCNRIMDPANGNTSLERLASLWKPEHCIHEFSNDTLITRSNNTLPPNIRPWRYQTCTEFGYFQSLQSKKQPFGNELLLEMIIDMHCIEEFGPSFNKSFVEERVRETNIFYGGKEPELSNVIFVHGTFDPWHKLGVVTNMSSTVWAFNIEGASHCEAMLGKKHVGPPEMARVLEEIERIVGKWVGSPEF